jgi:peptide/nickel transport system substrate-binding protein
MTSSVKCVSTSILCYANKAILVRIIARLAITRKENTELKPMIFLRTVAAAVLAVVATLAGCGSSTEKPGAGQKSNPIAEENQMNPQPRDKVQQGGKMTWAIDGVINNFNYNQLDGTLAVSKWVLFAMLPQMFVSDARAKPIYDPDYLSGEPELTPGPPQVVKYKLNPKAVWLDGSPITAADFIAQWKALIGKDPAFHISSNTGYDRIKSVTQGANQFEVIVTFGTPYADWKNLFSPVYPCFHEHPSGNIQYGLEKYYAHERRSLPLGEL